MAEPLPTTTEQDRQDAEERSSIGVLAGALLIIFIVVLILVFWRSCGAEVPGEDIRGAGGTIQGLEDLEVSPGGVAIWVKPDTDLDQILERNGLADASVADMGAGTYVISVGDSDAETVIEQLADDPGLYDAGYLYMED